MNYNENEEDELKRLRARRSRPAASRTRTDRRKSEWSAYDDSYYEEEDYESPAGRESSPKTARRTAAARKSAKSTGQSGKRQTSERQTATAERHPLSSGQPSKKQPVSDQRPNKRKRKKKHGFLKLLLLLLAVFLLYEGWVFLHRPTGKWTIAVFGVDSRDGNTKNALADVQIICRVDRATGEIRLVSVFRDTYMKIDSKGTYHKINEAYFKGGHKQAVDALEENLDLKIDDYATFNWKAVAQAINVLGGVDIDITPAEFKQINGFITETVNSTGIGSVQLSQAGPNHLDGVQAVAYCRLRKMDTDYQRTERQRTVIALALEKAKQADAATLSNLVKAILPEISTSISVNDVLPLVKDINKYHIGQTGGFPFSRQTADVGKLDCVIATTLESNVILLHQFLDGEDVSYHPSAAVKEISAYISEKTGLYEEGKAAPSGGSSGQSSGSGKNSGGAQAAPQPETTAAPETATEETVEESSEESEENIIVNPIETEETTKSTEEIGPGISGSGSHKTENETTKAEEKGPGNPGPGETAETEAPNPGKNSVDGDSSGGPGVQN